VRGMLPTGVNQAGTEFWSPTASLEFRWSHQRKQRGAEEGLRQMRWSPHHFLERTTGFEPATPTLAIAWRVSHASPPVSVVPLSCTFLALLSHPSHQIAGVDSISLVISLVLSPPGPTYLPMVKATDGL
jgi:hypothetical protein